MTEGFTRRRKRKVNGLEIGVECAGQKHIICLTPKGHLSLIHHNQDTLETDKAMAAIAGGECGCLAILKEWKAYSNTRVTTGSPVLSQYRTLVNIRDRLVSASFETDGVQVLKIKNHKLWKHRLAKFRHQRLYSYKPPPRPTDGTSLAAWAGYELTQRGMKVVKTTLLSNTECWLQVGSGLEGDPGDTKLTFSLNNSGSIMITGPFISGLVNPRKITKTNAEVVFDLIGAKLFRDKVLSMASSSVQTLATKKASETQILIRKFEQSAQPGYGQLGCRVYNMTNRFEIDISRSPTFVRTMPYILSRLAKILNSVHKQYGALPKEDERADE